MKGINSDAKIKVLIVTYDFFPDNSPNTFRWFNIVEQWSENRNVEAFVIASNKGGLPSFEIHNGINIYRTADNRLFTWIKRQYLKISATKSQGKSEVLDVNKTGLIRKIYDLTWKRIYFPDFAFLWQRKALKKSIELIDRENIKNVITVSWPFSGHVVGYNLKKRKDIFWIADTIDPFSLSKAVNNNFLYQKLNYRYEKKILSNADRLCLLTEKLKNKYISIFSIPAERIIVIPNLFISPKIIGNNKALLEHPDLIKMLFIGTLAPKTRSPRKLLSLFVSLLNRNALDTSRVTLELHFYGNYKACINDFKQFHSYLGRNIFLHEFIPKESVHQKMQDADILVNIGNNNEYQEPSKILEYISMQKPIINVCSINEDTSLNILMNYNNFYNFFPEDLSNDKKIEELYKFILTKERTYGQINPILELYSLNRIEKLYFEQLDLDIESETR